MVVTWKQGLQLSDLGPPDRIEISCPACGHVTKIYPGDPLTQSHGHLFLDELERRARCKQRALRGTRGGCDRPMRLLLCSEGDSHAFQAGIV